jgi:hypothetical protein
MYSHLAHTHHSLPLHNPPPDSETESDNDRKLPAVVVVAEEPTPQNEKRKKPFTAAEMRGATKLLEQCEEYMTKSKDGRIPKRYDPLMCKLISINDRMDEAFRRKWIKDQERAKETALMAEKNARANLFKEARNEVCDRYTALLAGLKEDFRLKAPRHALQKIIDHVTQEMNLPPDMKITKDHIHKFHPNRNKPLKKTRALGIPKKAGKNEV